MAEAARLDLFDQRYTGLDCSGVEPWYVTGMRTWIAMAGAIQRGVPGIKPSRAWADTFEARLKRERPDFLYKFYADWNRMVDVESRR